MTKEGSYFCVDYETDEPSIGGCTAYFKDDSCLIGIAKIGDSCLNDMKGIYERTCSSDGCSLSRIKGKYYDCAELCKNDDARCEVLVNYCGFGKDSARCVC